jgi:hypothetical protein
MLVHSATIGGGGSCWQCSHAISYKISAELWLEELFIICFILKKLEEYFNPVFEFLPRPKILFSLNVLGKKSGAGNKLKNRKKIFLLKL